MCTKNEPTNKEWQDLIDKMPNEVVDIDANGKYDKEKSPNFHDWMVNG